LLPTRIVKPPTGDLRTLIVADDPLARAGLASLLVDRPPCLVVGQLSGASDIQSGLNVYDPDVLLWDLGWNAAVSLERLADLRDLDLAVVALLPDDSQVMGTWSAGAHGLLLRNTDGESLLAALTAVWQGLVVLDPVLAAAMFTVKEPGLAVLSEDLTAREREVLQYLAEGLPNKAIAQKLGVTEHTIKFHVNAILTKLGAQSRTEAVVRATRLGLIIL
jgi:two-component system nitrate/nitrite response regulator NarL